MLTLQSDRPCWGLRLELPSSTGDRQSSLDPACRAGTVHGWVWVLRNRKGQSGHPERIRGDDWGSRLLERECWSWDLFEAGVRTSEASWGQVALGAGKVSEKALRLKKRPTEANIADLATKCLSRSRMEMRLAAGNLVLVSGERGTSFEYILMNSGGTNGEYILMHSEVNRFLLIVMLFLCVGGVLNGVFYYVITEMLFHVHVESHEIPQENQKKGNQNKETSRCPQAHMCFVCLHPSGTQYK